MMCKRIGFLAACLLTAAASGGCLRRGAADPATAINNAAPLPSGSAAPVANADRYKVRAETTPFYRYGPQQLNGSDQDLKKDSRLTMLQRARGYSRVRLPDNEVGYVGTEDITQLDANEIAAEDAAKLAAAAAAAPPGALTGPMGVTPAAGGPRYTIPSEAGRSESLPVADPNPAPKPPPTIFRY